MAEMNADTEMGSAQQEHIQGLYNLDYDLQLDKSLPPLSTTEPMENALVAQTQALELGTETPTEKMGREPGPSNKKEETPATAKKESEKPQKGKKSAQANKGKSSRRNISKSSNRGKHTSRGGNQRPRPTDWVDKDTVFWDGIQTVARLEARQRVEEAAAAHRNGSDRRSSQNQRRRQEHNRRGRGGGENA